MSHKRPPDDKDMVRREAKRRDINSLRYALPYMSQNALASICQWAHAHGGLPDVRDAREIRQARDELMGIGTPYGPLLVDVPFKTKDGGEIKMEFLHPWAGLYHITRISKAFSDLIRTAIDWNEGCSPDSPFELVLYSDEVTPGNQLAHRNARKVQTIYWTFLDFGPFLCCEELWITGSVISVEDVKRIEGGWSHVMGYYTKLFFAPLTSHADMSIAGIDLHLKGGSKLHIWVDFGLSLSDELAGSNQLFGLKGPSGLKCCRWCVNVHNEKLPRSLDPGWAIVHTCADISKFKLHTPKTMERVVMRIRSAEAEMGPEDFKALQTTLGFNFNPLGVLYDDFLRGKMEPSRHSMADWQHVLLVGGVVQRHIGLFFWHMRKTSMTYNSFHDYALLYSWPKAIGGQKHAGVDSLGPPRDKINLESQTFKCYASEGRSLLPVLGHFIRQALPRCTWTNSQKGMAQCVLHLCAILGELEAAARGVANLASLQNHLEKHMEMCVRCPATIGLKIRG